MSFQNTLFRVTSPLYAGLSSARNFLFDAGILDTVILPKPVVSVGNLTLGGTGKTPFTQMLIERILSKNKRPALIGRNYRGRSRAATRVNPKIEKAAEFYGDEPTLLAEQNPQVPVFVGPRKWETACLAMRGEDFDMLIIDDGFQHRSLHRDLDIVLLDATALESEYHLFPIGRARESFGSLQRADFIVLSKVNFAKDFELAKIQSRLPKNIPVLQMAYRLESPVEDAGAKVFAVSGIARPETFHLSLKQDTLFDVVGYMNFPDHHQFDLKDLKKIKSEMIRSGASLVVMTEKDHIKLGTLMQASLMDLSPDEVRVLPLKPFFLDSVNSFDEALDRLLLPK